MAFGFYLDSGLTQSIVSNFQVTEGIKNFQFYLGNPSSTSKLQNSVSPGLTTMYISVEDVVPGSGPEISWVKLAFTYNDLANATPGAPLDIGTTIYGGTTNAVTFWVQIINSLSGVNSSVDLRLKVTGVKEFII
jgi:hypothetical protein